jgi:hypothetical protein
LTISMLLLLSMLPSPAVGTHQHRHEHGKCATDGAICSTSKAHICRNSTWAHFLILFNPFAYPLRPNMGIFTRSKKSRHRLKIISKCGIFVWIGFDVL